MTSARLGIVLRIVLAGLIVTGVIVALVPLWILLDLRGGGTGWGLCADGFGACRTTYFAGFEFVAGFFAVMFLVLFAIRVCVQALRRLERRERVTILQEPWGR